MTLLFLAAIVNAAYAVTGRKRGTEVDLEAAADPQQGQGGTSVDSSDHDKHSDQDKHVGNLDDEDRRAEAQRPPGRKFTWVATTTSVVSNESHHSGLSGWFGRRWPRAVKKDVTLRRTSSAYSTTTLSSEISDVKPLSRRKRWTKKLKDFVTQSGYFDDHIDFVPHYRLLPIFSGILIPFSILLEIPGLTGHWYIRTEGNVTVEVQKNPRILDAGMGISMACGIIANLALIRRYMEHRPKQMTVIAISMLTIHDIINAICTVVFAVERRFNDGFTYGQPFWMTVASTAISLCTNVSLMYDYFTTSDFNKHGSGLTRKQRSLVIVIMILLCWMALGAIVYSALLDLSFIDGLYIAVVSIETIGFGDLHPTNTASRVWAIFYNTLGILNLGMAISTCRETVIESFEHSYRKRLERLVERNLERRRRKIRKSVVKRMLKDSSMPVYVRKASDHTGRGGGRGGPGHRVKPILNERALSVDQLQLVNNEVEEKIQQHHALGSDGHTHHELQQAETIEDLRDDLHSYGGTQRLLETLGHGGHSSALEAEQRREFLVKLSTAWGLFMSFWLIGGVIFSRTEGWGYGTSLYFCFITFSTIGYGDYAPETPAGRSIFVVWALLGVGTMTILISVLAEAYSSKYHSILQSHNFHKAVQHFRRQESDGDKLNGAEDNDLDEKTAVLAEKDFGLLASPTMNVEPSSAGSTSSALNDKITAIGGGEVDVVDLPMRSYDLPLEILQHMMVLQAHTLYFLSHDKHRPPASLIKLLDDVSMAGDSNGAQLDHRGKKEVLSDEAGRKLLYMLSYEDCMRKIIMAVERCSVSHSRGATTTSTSMEELPQLVPQSPTPQTRLVFSEPDRMTQRDTQTS